MKKDQELNRREALKLLAAGSTLAGSGLYAKTDVLSAKGAALTHPASHKHARIVIAGGGTAGMIAAARVRRAAPNAEITLISPNAKHLYQPGALFRAAGLMSEAEMVRDTSSFFPDNVRWLQEKVTAFDPQKRIVESEKSGKIPYDVLIVALGCSYNYGAIEGMAPDRIGKEGVCSIYLNDTVKGTAEGAELSHAVFQKLQGDIVTASKPLEILFCEPDTPVKGKGSALSLMLLWHDMLKKKGGGQKVRFTYVTPSSQLLDEKEFDEALKKRLKKDHDVEILYGHTLQKIDTASKKATLVSGDKSVERGYDYIHITPPMQAHPLVRNSALAVSEGPQKGWMDVDPVTLRHRKYDNIFGLGDIIALDYAKSGGAAQHQGIILQDNIAAALEGEKLTYHYDGYTVAPVVTAYGKVLLAEYNHQKASPTFFLDPYEPRLIWWWLQRYFMPWAYFNLLMRGMM